MGLLELIYRNKEDNLAIVVISKQSWAIINDRHHFKQTYFMK